MQYCTKACQSFAAANIAPDPPEKAAAIAAYRRLVPWVSFLKYGLGQ
jgi:hypothetical protein